VAVVPRHAATVREAENLAGEPRDDVSFPTIELADAAVRAAPSGIDADALACRAALARSLLLAGALERVLAMTVHQAREREQFGRPIGRFQAIQQDVARMAAAVAAARAAADAAVERPDPLTIAVAKIQTGEAATVAATIAHQIHGAIGFTDEHALHHHTRRLWAWRDEDGSETFWAQRLGEAVAAAGATNLWPLLTGERTLGGDTDD
jgi:acyl-CoA dehydrogenase